MAIVKNIVDGHSGKVDVVSQRNVGTTVTVTLPKKTECETARSSEAI